MNNSQFRKLLSSTDEQRQDGEGTPRPTATSALGSKKSAFGSMTPRNVSGQNVDFARQVRERNAALQPTRKFKSTAAPKGTKFGAGYTDRAKARAEIEADGDDKGERIKALEEQMKLGQISEATFEALRDEITGGDVGATHLVKGLDRKLLERVRRGEDVLGVGSGVGGGEKKESSGDVDEELDKLEEKQVEAVKREETTKKGSLAAAPPQVAGVKRSRDEIMAELRAQRKAAADAKAAAAPRLDGRFKRIDEKQKPKVEIDAKGREIVTIVGPDGKIKKKVRKVTTGVEDEHPRTSLQLPDASKPVLGSDVVVPKQPKFEAREESDDDIFEGVGTAYDPIADEGDDDSEESGDGDETATTQIVTNEPRDHALPSSDEASDAESDSEAEGPPTNKQRTSPPRDDESSKAPRNYFNDKPSTTAVRESATDRTVAIQEVLKKAANMGALGSRGESGGDPEEEARRKRHAEMLAQRDRDMDDMDVGFGGSRFEDEDGGEDEAKVKLSQWKGGGNAWDDGEDGEKGVDKGGKRKRKPKKRKGDGNNMADVMRVIEGRKEKGG